MNISYHARLLGFAGLTPFVFLPVFTLLDFISYFEGLTFFVQYSAIILSFLGGTIWFDSIHNQKSVWQLYFAILPSVIGWISITILPLESTIIILLISFIVVLIVEFRLLKSVNWYKKLRARLTSVAIGGHLMMLWLMYL